MKLLVISDIHAYAESETSGKPSYAKAGQGASTCPKEIFLKYLEKNPHYQPDVIICPGDMCDKSDRVNVRILDPVSRIVLALKNNERQHKSSFLSFKSMVYTNGSHAFPTEHNPA